MSPNLATQPSNPLVPTWEDTGLIRSGVWLARQFASYFHRITVVRPFPAGLSGPIIIACNHISYLDPLCLQAACPRLITWMMAQEYYDLPGVNWVCRQVRAIPVQRQGRDMAATRAALRALEEGRILGLFPEGRLETARQLLPFQVGIALLAMRSRATVVPTYIEGTQRGQSFADSYLAPQRTRLRFGRPFDLLAYSADRDGLQAATDQIHAAVDTLRTEEFLQFPSE
jgi:1-acyl-sn-glycerol-3-phosphate acyltransferase